ncbi:LysR substrate-binding domain-containing protein [Microbulbifer sp. MLAF003]|uniref:LysR family transcriptional regulator n=1 Tax=Microbulbifer sp. MLAF003 TaxID=3032582 RepID=UPI0024AE3B55|nr:LysR family transcriptional regulator [Microbulbifer sp. MLAF003]WHI51691.1 LysR substrate-binding domain-containing protein [Microbulbifer sp. MLAF003]
MNKLSWRAIRAFLSVAEYGSFTAAAEHSGFSKANLSQQVSELEAALGVQLLYRTTRKLRLTEIGEGYYQRCKLAMQQLDTAAEWASQSKAGIKGSIRINAVGGVIGEELIAPLVIDFQRKYPEVRVHLDFSSVRVDLVEEQYDLVIRMGTLPDSSLIVRKLHNIKTRYVASPDFLSTHGPITKPSDLSLVPLVYGSVDQWVMTRGKAQQVVQANQGIKLVSGRAMHLASLAGLGVTRLADVYVQADIAGNRLVEILPGWSESTILSMVCPPLKHQLIRVRSLMEWLKERFPNAYQLLLENGPAG